MIIYSFRSLCEQRKIWIYLRLPSPLVWCSPHQRLQSRRHRQLSFPSAELTCFAGKLKRVSLLESNLHWRTRMPLWNRCELCGRKSKNNFVFSACRWREKVSEVASSRGFKFDNGFCGIDENKGNTMLYWKIKSASIKFDPREFILVLFSQTCVFEHAEGRPQFSLSPKVTLIWWFFLSILPDFLVVFPKLGSMVRRVDRFQFSILKGISHLPGIHKRASALVSRVNGNGWNEKKFRHPFF